ncbi:hypothetical protein SAMN05216464_11363 [Mucilaginibacter pineti]|uniref:ATP-binding protein n=2 Tax=Mucilaginibacter pineti TaxID=1391627 RepID=A0A1G7IKM6_9SPHI|nr:hypothetical protein SAMN05216464_11363 [Mucilaginibacter pineti]
MNIFKTHPRYLRSTNLERDWHDPEVLSNYVITPQSRASFEKINLGLKPQSGMRAWRITGDYGSGKSSFALFAANLLDQRNEDFLPGGEKLSLSTVKQRIIPLLITGHRGSLALAICNSVLGYLVEFHQGMAITIELQELIATKITLTDAIVIQYVKKLHEVIVQSKKAAGIAIFIDEAGKFLEYAASRSEQEDIYLLQSLAELASRSGKHPIVIVTILHQGLNAYAERLSKGQQREWEKIAGRFEEVLWHHPLDQVAMLIAHSTNVDMDAIPSTAKYQAVISMKNAIRLGWYGYNVNADLLTELAPRLYPLEPTIIPVLVRVFTLFGQNERSLFSFLLGSEDFGLQEFVLKTEGQQYFRLYNLYDYVKATFGAKLPSLSYYWKAIDEVVNIFPPEKIIELQLLKTIGLINLINSDALIPSKELILAAVGTEQGDILDELKAKQVIYYRGHAGGYCVWPHSSVNIEDCYQQAILALGPPAKDIKNQLKQKLSTRPLVARRHYIATGNLRYFEIQYVDVNYLKAAVERQFEADGLIVVPLCETQNDVRSATIVAVSDESQQLNNVIIVVPAALNYLSEFLEEVRRWEWVERSVGELRHDRFAREEVSRKLAAASLELQRHLQKSIGLNAFSDESELAWYFKGEKQLEVVNGRSVMGFLSDICDATYFLAPKIHNELVNRRDPSPAATSARLRLCERMFEYSNMPYLGMDSEKHPPEMSMYLSVLQAAGLHNISQNGTWEISLPQTDYDALNCNVIPAMRCIDHLLSNRYNERVPVTEVFNALQAPPFGVRNGMIPVLLAVFIVINEQAVAVYEDGSFIPRITGSNFLRLIKAPETFDIQYYPISTLRTSLFSKLVQDLGFDTINRADINLLDVVKPLFVFMSGLPEYVMNTTSLDPRTQKVRGILRATRDPIKLLFTDLPIATEIGELKGDFFDAEIINDFSARLKMAIDEMRASFPALLRRLLNDLLREFDLNGTFESNRVALADRGRALAPFVTEIRLKSYCLRLADLNLNADQWAESLSNLICSMPANKWRDRDMYKFGQEIHQLTQQFLRVEATVYDKTNRPADTRSVRVSLTKPDGQERDQVIHLTAAEAEAADTLEFELQKLLSSQGQVGIAAASSLLWKMLSDTQKPNLT